METFIVILMISHFCIVILKLFGMTIFGTYYNLTKGKAIADKFHEIKKRKGTRAAIRFLAIAKYDPLRFYKSLVGWIPCRVLRVAVSFYYKWPTLVLVTSATTAFLPISPVQIFALKLISAILLAILIIAELLHEFTARLNLGVIDNLRGYVDIDVSSVDKINLRRWNLTKVLRDFYITISVQLICITIAFSSFYWFLAEQEPKHFGSDIKSKFDAIYFSVTTATTTGYGDITPELFLSKLIVTTQMVVTWSFLILIAGHFAMTLTESIDNSPNKAN